MTEKAKKKGHDGGSAEQSPIHDAGWYYQGSQTKMQVQKFGYLEL